MLYGSFVDDDDDFRNVNGVSESQVLFALDVRGVEPPVCVYVCVYVCGYVCNVKSVSEPQV